MAGAPRPPDEPALERALEIVGLLADDIGPRRPTGAGERKALLALGELLSVRGLRADLEPFAGYASFGFPFGAISAAAVAPGLMPPAWRRRRVLTSMLAAASMAAEGGLVHTPLSNLLSRRESANLVGEIAPEGEQRRTLCLMAHADTSRSGLIFDPRFVGYLQAVISAQAIGTIGAAVAELAGGWSRRGRLLAGMLRSGPLLAAALLAEREARGEEVPGANDNASGCAVAATLAAERARSPLESTRLVLLISGCEESGTLGSQAFLREHDTTGWLFLNIDNVGGPGSVRYLRREGVLTKWSADPGLVGVADRVAAGHPGLRMAPTDAPAGLTYDTSPILARGGRALTLSVQDGSIPNLHWPTDTVENLDPGGVARTLGAARLIVESVDRGEAD